MNVSLGFLVVLFLVLFPGLIFRRLYFYGEFSKQFNSGYNLIRLIAVASIPGIIILICVYRFYNHFVTEIDLDEIIDKFKDINNPNYRLKKSNNTPLENLLREKIAPFIGFLYLNSVILGSILGRFIRISKIDTKFKLLRFKNYWFYLFNGHHTGFKKMRHLKEKNKKHLFTKADILIDSNNKTLLYSGIVVDYELEENNSSVLSKVMLQNAERYSLRNNVRVPVAIPGTLLVVECSSMKNINLTYIYEESKSISKVISNGIKSFKDFITIIKQFLKNILESKFPSFIELLFSLIFVLLIPVFIFKSDSISFEIYTNYFKLPWYGKIVVFLLSIQVLSVIYPFRKVNEEYKYVTWKNLLAKIIWVVFLLIILWIWIL